MPAGIKSERRPASPRNPHLYAHCQRGTLGGVTLLALNLENRPNSLGVAGPANLYALTNPDLQSKTALLNGKALALAANDTLPVMDPVMVKGHRVSLAPTSINFITLPQANNLICRD
jgi:heparanase